MPSAPPFDRADGRDYYDGREYYHDYHQQNRRPYKQGSYVSHNIHNKNTGRQPFRSKYMSADEIESIARIQLAATHINDPYIDDYYHQASQAKLAGGSPHGRRPFAPFHLRDSTSHRRSPALQPTFVPVDGLGKVAFSSIRRPRPLLEVDDSSGGDTNKDVVRPLEQEPMLAARIAIEDGLCSLLDVDDIDRFLSVSQLPDGGAQLRRQRQMILESLAALLQLVDPPRGNNGSGSFETNAQIIGDDRKDDFVFLRLVVSLSKGRKMVCRYLKLLPQGSLLVQIVCTAVFRHLRFLFGLPQNDPNAARATTELAETVANCVSRMNLNSLRACLAAVVSTPEHPPLKLFAGGPSDGASLVLKSVLNRATSLLTNPGIPFPPEDRAMWQVVFDHFFHLLYTFCTNKFDSILCSLAMSSSGGHPLSINTLAAEAMTKEMPIELLRSSLPHMNEHQRKSLLEFTQRSVAFGAAGGQTLG
jgi:DNA topoisomerase 2-associated protein PAT1